MNRREIGHGALAERSIEPVIPDEADFPYAIRVTSEVMESNGSTSMASVCAGIMALHGCRRAAEAPGRRHLRRPRHRVRQANRMNRYITLLDIIGSEDHFGDMDFKLCGTTEGVTGYQLDLKLPGIPLASSSRRSTRPGTAASRCST